MDFGMATKPDFAKAAARWGQFWRGKHPQPLIAAVLPKDGVTEIPKPSTYALGPDLDPAAFAEQTVGWAETHDFLGAAIPFVYLEFAADQFSTFLGADLRFPSPGEGGWPIHPYADCPLADIHIQFQPSGIWWQRIAELANTIQQRAGDGVLIASPTLVANLDSLVALRGAQTVLMDLMDSPDEVKRLLGEITAAHGEILAAFADLLHYRERGSINRHGMYSSGAINVPQCDFSCMISPAMFDDFVLPCLREEFARFGGGEYHLDGPDAIRHLDSLCSIQDLHVIQWVAGAGDTRRDWSDLYRRIDRLGKGQILGGSRQQLDRWMEEFTAGRLFWAGLGRASRAEVEQTLSDYGW